MSIYLILGLIILIATILGVAIFYVKKKDFIKFNLKKIFIILVALLTASTIIPLIDIEPHNLPSDTWVGNEDILLIVNDNIANESTHATDFKTWKEGNSSFTCHIAELSYIQGNSSFWVNGTWGDNNASNPYMQNYTLVSNYTSFNQTPQLVRNYIRYVNSTYTSVEYVILFGGYEDVPISSRIMQPAIYKCQGTSCTGIFYGTPDIYYYGCLYGSQGLFSSFVDITEGDELYWTVMNGTDDVTPELIVSRFVYIDETGWLNEFNKTKSFASRSFSSMDDLMLYSTSGENSCENITPVDSFWTLESYGLNNTPIGTLEYSNTHQLNFASSDGLDHTVGDTIHENLTNLRNYLDGDNASYPNGFSFHTISTHASTTYGCLNDTDPSDQSWDGYDHSSLIIHTSCGDSRWFINYYSDDFNSKYYWEPAEMTQLFLETGGSAINIGTCGCTRLSPDTINNVFLKYIFEENYTYGQAYKEYVEETYDLEGDSDWEAGFRTIQFMGDCTLSFPLTYTAMVSNVTLRDGYEVNSGLTPFEFTVQSVSDNIVDQVIVQLNESYNSTKRGLFNLTNVTDGTTTTYWYYGLNESTTYYWYICLNESGSWHNYTFDFVTEGDCLDIQDVRYLRVSDFEVINNTTDDLTIGVYWDISNSTLSYELWYNDSVTGYEILERSILSSLTGDWANVIYDDQDLLDIITQEGVIYNFSINITDGPHWLNQTFPVVRMESNPISVDEVYYPISAIAGGTQLDPIPGDRELYEVIDDPYGENDDDDYVYPVSTPSFDDIQWFEISGTEYEESFTYIQLELRCKKTDFSLFTSSKNISIYMKNSKDENYFCMYQKTTVNMTNNTWEDWNITSTACPYTNLQWSSVDINNMYIGITLGYYNYSGTLRTIVNCSSLHLFGAFITPPIISDEIPENNSYVFGNLTELSVNISDNEGDNIWWSITTSPDIGNDSGWDNVSEVPGSLNWGIHTCNIDSLIINQTYIWNISTYDGTFWGNETFYCFVYTYGTEIKSSGIDYFIWLGINTTLDDISNSFTNLGVEFGDGEYIGIWSKDGVYNKDWFIDEWWYRVFPWNSSGYGSELVSTFDIIKTYITDDIGEISFSMAKSPDIDYTSLRNVTLTTTTAGKNFIGWTNYNTISAYNLSIINITTILDDGEIIYVWDEDLLIWDYYIVGFSDLLPEIRIDEDDVIMISVYDQESIEIGGKLS